MSLRIVHKNKRYICEAYTSPFEDTEKLVGLPAGWLLR